MEDIFKSLGKIFGNASTSQYGYEKNYLDYLRNYDTSNYDKTLQNMTQQAQNMSQNLNNMPNYHNYQIISSKDGFLHNI